MPTFSLKEISVNNATYILLNSKGTFRFRKRSHIVPFAHLVLLKGKGNEKVNTGNTVVWKGQVINNMCINTSYFKAKNHFEVFFFSKG